MESAAPVPYPLAADFSLNGVWLSDQPWAVSDIRQAYDFATGELTSRFRVVIQNSPNRDGGGGACQA